MNIKKINTVCFMPLFMLLFSCNSADKIKTSDDSVDYWKVEARPHLKKSSSSISATTQAKQQYEFRLIESKSKTRLKVSASFDNAWDYMADRLASSGVSIFTKNKQARQYEIGCNGIDSNEDENVKKSWFGKKQQQHCFLQFSPSRKSVLLSVYKRDGKELDANAANVFFKRILNTQ